MAGDDQAVESLLSALSEIDAALTENIDRSREIQRRVRRMRKELMSGKRTVAELVAAEDQPRAVEMLTANAVALETSGATFRGNLARALREEGLTIEAVAELFGVTRQRISSLLRQERSRSNNYYRNSY